MCSGSRSFLPYRKWFSIFSENRLASVVTDGLGHLADQHR